MKRIVLTLMAVSATLLSCFAQNSARQTELPGGLSPRQAVELTNSSVNTDLALPVRPAPSPFAIPPAKTLGVPSSSPLRHAVPLTDFNGVLIASTAWPAGEPKTGYYSFSATAPTRKMIYKNTDMGSAYGTLLFGDRMFTMIYFELFGTPFTGAYFFDLNTGELIRNETNVGREICSTSMAYDPSTGKAYGCFLNSTHTAHEFGILDLNSLKRTTISTLPGYLYGMSFTPDGRLVGLNPRTGNLYEINKQTGALSLIGATGISSTYASSGAVCPKTGRMYFCVCNDNESALYLIDTRTAKATKVYVFPDQAEIMGMRIPMPSHADLAPAAAQALNPIFEGISLSGQIDFTAPELTFDGSPGTAQLSYILKCDGTLLSSDTIAWGASKSIPYNSGQAAFRTFSLSFSTLDGEGPETSASIFIGESMKPASVAQVNVSPSTGKIEINWTKVDSLFYGGEFNPNLLSYRVRRLPDNTIVAAGLTDTLFTDLYPEPSSQKLVSYEVIPVYRNTEGDATASEQFVYGFLTPPFKETFSKTRAPYVKTWTIVDADGDGVYNWTHDASGGRIRTKSNASSRDIYATPRVYLEPDRIYTVKYGLASYSSTKTASVSCWLSKTLDAAGFSRCLVEKNEPVSTSSKTSYKYYTADFSVDSPGFYYIGIKNEGGTGTYNYVDNVEMQTPAITAAPAAPSDLKAVAAVRAGREVKISFKAPSLTAGGDQLTSLSGIEIYRNSQSIARITDNVAPGMEFCVDDTVDQDGVIEYSVSAFNTAGHGPSARVSIYSGVNIPGTVTNVSLRETDEGVVTIGWKAPEVDADGYPMNPDKVRYRILRPDRSVVADNLTDTTYSCRAVPQGKASFVSYYIHTVSDKGESPYMVGTDMIAVGSPCTPPLEESFPDGEASTLWASMNYNPAVLSAWKAVKEVADFPSADGDGGFLMSHSDDVGGKIALSSIKIRLTCEAPALSFYYYAIPGSHNTIEARAFRNGEQPITLATYKISETGKLGWIRAVVPLNEFAGKDMRVELLANCVNNSQTHFDDIRVGSLRDYDVELLDYNAPATVYTNRDNSFNIRLRNLGKNGQKDVRVQLLTGDSVAAEEVIPSIDAGAFASVTLNHRPAVTSAGKLTYRIRLTASKDDDLSNNESEDIPANLVLPDYPTVQSMYHTLTDQGIRFTWDAPAPVDTLSVEGYNIYRDKRLRGSSLTPVFTDTDFEKDTPYIYQVAVKYNLGESALSEPYSVKILGIGSIADGKLMVVGGTGELTIHGAADAVAVITDAAGITRTIQCRTDAVTIPASTGVNIVTIFSPTSPFRIFKTIVK